MSNRERLEPLTLDALKEITNIAVGHFSEIVSQLTKTEMNISVPKAQILSMKNASDLIGEKSIVAGFTTIFGGIKSSLIFFLSKDDAMNLTRHVLNTEANPQLFPSPAEKEALTDLINITGGAYISAITEFLGTYLIPKSPTIGLFGAFNLSNFIVNIQESKEDFQNNDLVMISIEYKVESSITEGEMMLIIGPKLVENIQKKIKERTT